jgi:predicted RNase H-like HicB family nuclease
MVMGAESSGSLTFLWGIVHWFIFFGKNLVAARGTGGIVFDMLTEYLRAAMARAHYEILGGGEGIYGEIPGFQGVFAQADTLEACREELASTLEDWLLFRISQHLPLPVLPGLDLVVRESSALA